MRIIVEWPSMKRDEHVDRDQPILQKAEFGDIYDQPDPRAYFNTLGAFDYWIPQVGADVFRRVLQARATDPHQASTVLDIGCS